MAGRRGARSLPDELETLVEQGRGLPQAVGLDAPGSQLDRQRDAVELAADADDDGCFGVAELQARAARGSPLEEQLGRGKAPRGERRGTAGLAGTMTMRAIPGSL